MCRLLYDKLDSIHGIAFAVTTRHHNYYRSMQSWDDAVDDFYLLMSLSESTCLS